MKKMYSYFCLIVLLFIQNATSTKTKVYVIDLEDTDTNEDKIELSELLKLITKSKEKPFKETKLDRYINNKSGDENACLKDPTATQLEKIKCLAKIQSNKLGKSSYNEFYTQRPKRKIYSLYNYYRGNLKSIPITDSTREEFSQDYLDIGDLSRLGKCSGPHCKISDYHRRLGDFDVDKVSNVLSQDSRRRTIKDSDERGSTSSETESSESSLEDRSIKTKRHREPSRFQVVFNEDSSIESEEEKPRKPKKSYSSESEEKQWSSEEVKKPKKSSDKYAYLQGNKIYDDLRRRLQHFLPKRYHWDEDDIYNSLGYYWFDGPKDKYSHN